jgi:hypothetical protein
MQLTKVHIMTVTMHVCLTGVNYWPTLFPVILNILNRITTIQEHLTVLLELSDCPWISSF